MMEKRSMVLKCQQHDQKVKLRGAYEIFVLETQIQPSISNCDSIMQRSSIDRGTSHQQANIPHPMFRHGIS
jgi:hypothetical protein